MVRFIPVAVIVIGMSISGMGTFCDLRLVERAWRMCMQVYAPDDMDRNTEPIDSCKFIECHIQCMQDAVGDCLHDDSFLQQMYMYDAEKYKVLYRAECSNPKMYKDSSKTEVECPSTQICPDDPTSTNRSLEIQSLFDNRRYEEYKKEMCRMYKKSRECISIPTSDSCSAEKAAYYHTLIKIGTSMSICENSDLVELYTKYSGEAQCTNPKIDSKCFESGMMSKVSHCLKLPIHNLTSMTESMISNFCESVECNIKCFIDGVGSCHHLDQNIHFDTAVIKVASRAACLNPKVLISAIQNCKVKDVSCHVIMMTTMADAQLYLDEQNFAQYKSKFCSAESEFIKCLDYTVDERCTAEMAKVLTDIFEIYHSHSKCGKQNHPLFTKYAFEAQCSGSVTVPSSYTLIWLAIAVISIVFI